MQISKSKVSSKINKEIKSILAQTIIDLKTLDNMLIFLRDFLTPAEFLTLAKRLAIAIYLEKGKSYDEIKHQLKVSSATVATVQATLEQQSEGFMLALKQIRAEEWADEWSAKITRFVHGISGAKDLDLEKKYDD